MTDSFEQILDRTSIARFCTRHRVYRLSVIHGDPVKARTPAGSYDVLVEFESGESPSTFEVIGMEIELSELGRSQSRSANLRSAETHDGAIPVGWRQDFNHRLRSRARRSAAWTADSGSVLRPLCACKRTAQDLLPIAAVLLGAGGGDSNAVSLCQQLCPISDGVTDCFQQPDECGVDYRIER